MQPPNHPTILYLLSPHKNVQKTHSNRGSNAIFHEGKYSNRGSNTRFTKEKYSNLRARGHLARGSFMLPSGIFATRVANAAPIAHSSDTLAPHAHLHRTACVAVQVSAGASRWSITPGITHILIICFPPEFVWTELNLELNLVRGSLKLLSHDAGDVSLQRYRGGFSPEAASSCRLAYLRQESQMHPHSPITNYELRITPHCPHAVSSLPNLPKLNPIIMKSPYGASILVTEKNG
jgi:hypothetical protein